VLLCTHNLFEAEQLCQRLSIVQAGRQIAQGTPAELKTGHATTCVLKVRERSPLLLASLGDIGGIDRVQPDGPGVISYQTRDPACTNPHVIRAAVAAGADVVALSESTATLEEVYLKLVGEAAHA
jgi:ABC-2 type transport system ATP-binding protein